MRIKVNNVNDSIPRKLGLLFFYEDICYSIFRGEDDEYRETH